MGDVIDLAGKVAVVTGAGRGIGRSHAIALATRGVSVVVNDLGVELAGEGGSSTPAQEVAEEIQASGGHAVANAADVSDEAGAADVIATALDAFGRIDIVINNAGITTPDVPLLETSVASFEKHFRVHFFGTYNVTRAAWPYLLGQSYGRVINTVSTGGIFGGPGMLEYCAAKGAVQSFTIDLAKEAEGSGITVNALVPGAWTRMTAGVAHHGKDAERNRIFRRPELVSAALVWMVSDLCNANGAIYEAFAGRVSRVRIGEPAGHWDLDLTPESVASNVRVIESTNPLEFPTDSKTWASAVLQRAQDLAAEAAAR